MSNILVTCAGSGVGQSAIDSLCQIRRDRVIGCDMNRNVYACHYCDEFYIVPSLFSEGYLDFILDICLKEKIDIVIPGHDHELSLLSANITKFADKGIEVIVSRPDLIKISRDKYEWYKYFKKYGCPVVPTFRVSEFIENPDFSIFPAIVKPSGGSASQGISIINSFEELSDVNGEDIIQPYLFPLENDPNYPTICKAVQSKKFVQMSEISMQLIFTKKSEFAGIFISRNVLKNGVPVLVEPILPEDFEYLDDIMKFVPVCVQHKVKGPVNIQGRITKNGLICFEMNMRFTGITGNRAQLGFNEVSFLVNNFLGIPARLNGYTSNKIGVRQVACTTLVNEELKYSKKVITVLGGGSIGSAFIDSLLRDDSVKKINLIVRPSSYEKYSSQYENVKIEVISGEDIYVETVLGQSDMVVNFIGALAYKPEKEMYESILYQQELIPKIVKSKVPLVINISSQSVYDQKQDISKNETESISLDNLYAFQKYISEEIFGTINKYDPSMRVISLRLSRVIDVNSRDSFFVKVVKSMQKNEPVSIPYPQNKINLVDIRDVVSAIKFIINNSAKICFPSTLNVGSENIAIIDYLRKATNKLNSYNNLSIGENQTVQESSMITTELINSLGWLPQYSIDEIISDIIRNNN